MSTHRGKGECDRCGFIYKLRQLHLEWTGYKVCRYCWDPLPQQDFPRKITAENQSLIGARPVRDTLVFIGRIRGSFDPIGRSFQGAAGATGLGQPTK